MIENKFPLGWNEDRVQKVIAYYEEQTEDEAVAEDEAAFEEADLTIMKIPKNLVPTVRQLIAQYTLNNQ